MPRRGVRCGSQELTVLQLFWNLLKLPSRPSGYVKRGLKAVSTRTSFSQRTTLNGMRLQQPYVASTEYPKLQIQSNAKNLELYYDSMELSSWCPHPKCQWGCSTNESCWRKKINAIFLILFGDTRLFEQWTVTQRAKVVMVDGERVPFWCYVLRSIRRWKHIAKHARSGTTTRK